MKYATALKKAHRMATDVIKGKLEERFLWAFCYEHGIAMSETWNEDEEIQGFAIEDYEYYY